MLALVTFGAAAVRYLNSPLRFDESEWPPQAEGVLRHGVPVVLYSEDKTVWIEPYYGFDAHYGMWHPPVYVWSLAASIGIFGRTDWAARLVSLVWLATAACLVWLILAGGDGRDRDWLLRSLPLSLVFLSPLVLEGAFYVDIDNTCLAAALFLMAYVHLRLDAVRPLSRVLSLALVTAFALWCKLTTPAAMAAAIVLHRWWQRGIRAAAVDFAAMVAAIPIFVMTYWTYCAAFDYPVRFMFDVSYLAKRGVITSGHSLRDILQSLRWNIVWISPAVMLAAMGGLVLRVRRFSRARNAEPVDLLFLFGMLALAPYVMFGLVGKYTAPVALALAAAAGHELGGAIRDSRVGRPGMTTVIALALAAFHTWLGPLQLHPPALDHGSPTLAESLADPRNLYLLLSGAAGVAAAGMIARRARATLAIGALVYVAAANPAGELRLVLSPADRSPLRPFVDRGFQEVVAYVNRADSSSVILAPKDIGYYFTGRNYRAETATRDLRELNGSPQVRFVVDSRLYPVLPDWRSIERAGFVRAASVGDYEVFSRQTSSPTGQLTPVPPRPQ